MLDARLQLYAPHLSICRAPTSLIRNRNQSGKRVSSHPEKAPERRPQRHRIPHRRAAARKRQSGVAHLRVGSGWRNKLPVRRSPEPSLRRRRSAACASAPRGEREPARVCPCGWRTLLKSSAAAASGRERSGSDLRDLWRDRISPLAQARAGTSVARSRSAEGRRRESRRPRWPGSCR